MIKNQNINAEFYMKQQFKYCQCNCNLNIMNDENQNELAHAREG